VRDYEGQTPAMYAKSSGLPHSEQMVQLLIEGGLNQESRREEEDGGPMQRLAPSGVH
jgi:hypothetical protein